MEQIEEDVERLLEAASAGDYEAIMVQLGTLAPGYGEKYEKTGMTEVASVKPNPKELQER
jgi:hypothetical protein